MSITGGRTCELSRLEGLGPGAHVCCVVESTSHLDALAAQCFAEGAANGEKLFRFVPESGSDGAPAENAVTVLDPNVSFLGGGPVDPEVMFAAFRQQTATAQDQGYRGIRVVADMDWLLTARPSRSELAAFELALNEVVAGLAATVVCAYRNEHFDPPTITEMVAVHPVTVGRIPTEPGFRMWYVSAGTWSVSGEIDASNAELFGRALTNAASQTAQLRLHAAGLRFIAVAGIRELITLAQARPDLRLVVEAASPAFQRTWQLLELDHQLPQVELVPKPAADPAAETPIAAGDGAR